MENLDLFTPVEQGLPKENNLGLSEWMQVCMFGRYSEIGRTEKGKWVDKYGKTINVTHYLDLSKLTTKESKKLPNSEDVKRWFQLLVGMGEEEMKKDMENTLL